MGTTKVICRVLYESLLTHLALAEIEPFDEALDRHIWSLSDQRLKWDREIARTRTEKPREVETMLQDLFDRQLEAGMEDREETVDEKDQMKSDRGCFILRAEYVVTLASTALDERLPQIEQVFQKTSALSEELNQVRDVVITAPLYLHGTPPVNTCAVRTLEEGQDYHERSQSAQALA
jgi:hypothetical protein